MTDQKAMREAMKLAKTKGTNFVSIMMEISNRLYWIDLKQVDPKVLDYAATKLQAGFRGYMTRKNLH